MVKHVVELIHGCWAALTADRAQAYQVLLLAVILSVALGLRLWGITFGLPYALHVDERALALPALKIIQTGDYNPHRFDYGSLHIYLLSLVYIGYFLYGARSGI